MAEGETLLLQRPKHACLVREPYAAPREDQRTCPRLGVGAGGQFEAHAAVSSRWLRMSGKTSLWARSPMMQSTWP